MGENPPFEGGFFSFRIVFSENFNFFQKIYFYLENMWYTIYIKFLSESVFEIEKQKNRSRTSRCGSELL